MWQKELKLPDDVAFSDLNFRYNSGGGFTINMGAILHFCDANDIDVCSVIPCSYEANNPGMTSMLQGSGARLQMLLDNWYTLHCARNGVRDIAYEGWLRRGEQRKKILRH